LLKKGAVPAPLLPPTPEIPCPPAVGSAWRDAAGDATSERPTAAWFAIWTRSRHEQRVLDQLREKQIEAFLPTVTRWSRWKDRRKKIDWPLFPGYCFARFDVGRSLPVLTCSGVVSLVSFEGRAAVVPDGEIESVRALVASALPYDPCPLIHEGAMVRVVSGPLRGVRGRLVRKGAHARLVLAVESIGQAVSVEIDAADVRAD
jgi:transcription antitermination factor NusG